jgi:dihydrodipicolinate synthase/N-acetylneuraminate lyase
LGVAGVKNAMAAQGRDVGLPRPPLQPLSPEAAKKLAAGIAAIPGMKNEPRGW